MTISSRRGAPRAVAAAILAVGLVASVLVLVARGRSASAADASLTLNYNCTFPLIGSQPIAVEIHTDIPSEVATGQATPAFNINAVASVSETARLGLRTVGAATLEGTVSSDAHLTVPGLDLPLSVDMNVPAVPIPATAGAFTVDAKGTTPPLTFSAANVGQGTITVGDLLMRLTPKTAAGAPTGLGTFDAPCTQVPGQNNVLQTITIVGGGGPTTAPPTTGTPTTAPPTTAATTTTTRPGPTTTRPTTPPTSGPSTVIKLAYSVQGTSFISSANGNVPVTGSINANFDLAAGTHVSQLTLQPAVGAFRVAGLIPTQAAIEFVPQGNTTGSLVDGKLTAHAVMTIKIRSIVLFGILPIAGGNRCQTSTAVTVDLASPDGQPFDPVNGGKLSGTFTMPSLANCGILGALVNIFVAGPDNTLDINLTPAAG